MNWIQEEILIGRRTFFGEENTNAFRSVALSLSISLTLLLQYWEEIKMKEAMFFEKMDNKVSVDCRVLQKEFIDLGGHGKRTVRNFMTALNMNLNR